MKVGIFLRANRGEVPPSLKRKSAKPGRRGKRLVDDFRYLEFWKEVRRGKLAKPDNLYLHVPVEARYLHNTLAHRIPHNLVPCMESQGHLAHKKPPPRITTGSYAEDYCRVLQGRCFLWAKYPCRVVHEKWQDLDTGSLVSFQ